MGDNEVWWWGREQVWWGGRAIWEIIKEVNTLMCCGEAILRVFFSPSLPTLSQRNDTLSSPDRSEGMFVINIFYF